MNKPTSESELERRARLWLAISLLYPGGEAALEKQLHAIAAAMQTKEAS